MASWGENDWVTIARYATNYEAFVARDFLESEGVTVFLADTMTNNFLGAGKTFLGPIAVKLFSHRLQVRQYDEDEGRRLLKIMAEPAEYIYPEGAFPDEVEDEWKEYSFSENTYSETKTEGWSFKRVIIISLLGFASVEALSKLAKYLGFIE